MSQNGFTTNESMQGKKLVRRLGHSSLFQEMSTTQHEAKHEEAKELKAAASFLTVLNSSVIVGRIDRGLSQVLTGLELTGIEVLE